jgi:hypothetical protein
MKEFPIAVELVACGMYPVVSPLIPPPPVEEITPPEIVMVVPSGLTAPKAPVVATGSCPAEAVPLISAKDGWQ